MRSDIKIAAELWASRVPPEGLLERWIAPDGAFVEKGEPVAAVRIEEALHEIAAPACGWLTVDLKANSVIDPGAVIGHIGS